MGKLPNLEEIGALHRKYAPKHLLDKVFTHCQIVWEIANQLIEKRNLNVDKDIVRAGCLLHDIGVYRLITKEGIYDKKNYIQHGVLGSGLLKSENVTGSVCDIAERHTGVGITKSDIIKQKLPIPLKDYLAETVEERLVMYADKFHSKTPKFNSYESYCNYIRRFGEEKVIIFKALASEFGKPDLKGLSTRYNMPLL